MNQLPQLIRGAVQQGSNSNQQKEAENGLIRLRQQDTAGFLLECANIVSNQSNDDRLRHSASIVLSRSAVTPIANSKDYYWYCLSPENRFNVREKLLAMLVAKSRVIMKAGASAIAQIAALEIANNSWMDLIEILAQNTRHQQQNIRMASIQTIGFLCEQMKRRRGTVSDHCAQQFLAGIIIGSRDSDLQIVQISLLALQNSLVILEPLLRQLKCREEIIKIISQRILNPDFVQKCYQILFEYTKTCYEYLGQTMGFFVELTVKHLQQREDSALLACQFWQSMGTQLLDRQDLQKGRVNQRRVQNYLIDVSAKIVPELMKLMVIIDKNDIEKTDMRESANKTLSVFCQCCDKSVVDIITQGISQILQSENPGQRQAVVPLFSTLCQFQDTQYIESCLKNGFTALFKLVTDSEVFVVRSTLIGLIRIFEAFSDIIIQMEVIEHVVNTLFDHIENHKDGDVVKGSLTALVFLTAKLDKLKHNKISSNPNILLKRLVQFYSSKVLGKNLPQDLSQKVIQIIISIIMGCPDSTTTVQLIEFMVTKYEFYDANPNQTPNLQVQLTQLITIIHTGVLTLKVQSSSSRLLLNKLLQITGRHQKRFGVDQEVINMIGGLAITFGNLLYPKLDELWPIVFDSLKSTDQAQLFKASLAAIGDFGRTYDSKFADKGHQVLGRLFQLVNNNMIDRTQRLCILYCLGDLFLGMKGYAHNFVDKAIGICNSCFAAAMELKKNPEQSQYFDELKEALIDMYACMIFSLNTNDKPNEKLFHNFSDVAYFIVLTCCPAANPTVNYLKSCLFLLFDGAQFYWKNPNYRQKVIDVVQSNQVKQLINMLSEIKNRPDLIDLIQYIRQRVTRKFQIPR